jgi:phage terminase small subunit
MVRKRQPPPRTPATTTRRLTPKQERFVLEYLSDLNATQAAIRAGYSPHTSNEQGARLLANVSVAAAITRGKQAQAERTGLTADRVLQEIARLAFVDMRKLFEADGSVKPIHTLDDDTAAALAGLEVDELYEGLEGERHSIGQTRKFKLWNKTENLKLLAKHLRLLVDRVELTHETGDGLAALLKEIGSSAQRNEQPHSSEPGGGIPAAP